MDTIATAWRQAQDCGARGDLAGAEAAFRRVLELAPRHAPTLLQLSYLESLKGRHQSARDLALRAASVKPEQPMVVAATTRPPANIQ